MPSTPKAYKVIDIADSHVGGGVIGCSIAYYLTHHQGYDPNAHQVVILEACQIAGAASGKAGGFVGAWATPKCMAKLSYDLHAELARKYDGEKSWGYRKCSGWDTKWKADTVSRVQANKTSNVSDHSVESAKSESPPGVEFLRPDVVAEYGPLGKPEDSTQVNPFLFTSELAKLAKDKGAQIIIGKAESLNYAPNGQRISSVTFTRFGVQHVHDATDVIVAAGPWTTRLLPNLRLGTPRSHSIVVRCPATLSPNIIFPVYDQENSTSQTNGTYPEIYPRPRDVLRDYPTVYTCGPDDYELELPETSDKVEVSLSLVGELRTALESVLLPEHMGDLVITQACHKPQLRPHKEGEEVGPAVGPVEGIGGLWVATGHDEWGVSNGPATGLIIAEMLFEGQSKSLDAGAEALKPSNFMN